MIGSEPHALGRDLPLWSVAPFAGLLLAIALFPLAAPRFWARHYGKVSAVFGLPVAGWFLLRAPSELLHTGAEYVSFVILLGSLFTISGGILFRGTIRATPAVNSAFLGAGAVVANLLGTTGASMLLIRPLIRANAHRTRSGHVVVFFIFVVANIGGLLTPVGDPPLFLGYLRGVPFLWTVEALWPLWAFAAGLVIAIFYLLDRRIAGREAREARPTRPAEGEEGERPRGTGAWDEDSGEGGAPPEGALAVSLAGAWNFPLLAIVIGGVFLPGPWREIAMAAAAFLSAWRTPSWIRRENGFSYHPIKEVAILFAGIFAAMMPALLILRARGGELGVSEPWHFFWATGTLSSFLDNAPTYLTFFSLAQGLPGPADVAGVAGPVLKAISAGAVFMGANSYIGNAPNFMVKAIAETAGIRMPTFFGYMGYAAAVLLPVFALVTGVFF